MWPVEVTETLLLLFREVEWLVEALVAELVELDTEEDFDTLLLLLDVG